MIWMMRRFFSTASGDFYLRGSAILDLVLGLSPDG